MGNVEKMKVFPLAFEKRLPVESWEKRNRCSMSKMYRREDPSNREKITAKKPTAKTLSRRNANNLSHHEKNVDQKNSAKKGLRNNPHGKIAVKNPSRK